MRDEITGEWRKLHYDELNYLFSSRNIAQVIKPKSMRWVTHVSRMMGERRVQGFGVEPEGKRPMGIPRRSWEDNIKMDLQEMGMGGIWTGSSWLSIGSIGTGGGHW